MFILNKNTGAIRKNESNDFYIHNWEEHCLNKIKEETLKHENNN